MTEKTSFLKRVPGFRSGVWWKKAIAIVFYISTVLVIIGLLLGSSLETDMKTARNYAGQGKFALAVSKYEAILKNWSQYRKATIPRETVEQELLDTRNLYARDLSSKAGAEIAAGNFQKADELVKQALKQAPSCAEAKAASTALEQALARKEADALLAAAEASLKAGDITKAIDSLAAAAAKAPDYERVSQMREKMAVQLMDEAGKCLLTAATCFGKWDLAQAKSLIDRAASLAPEHPDLPGMKVALAEREAIVKELGPKPENSAWDGSVAEVKDYLNKVLNDPSSVKYEEWSSVSVITYQGTKFWGVKVQFRAKNAFGAYVLTQKLALIRQGKVLQLLDY